jgi:hypothetical protein
MGFRRFQIGFMVLAGLVASTIVFYGCSSNSNSSSTTPTSQYYYLASGNTFAGLAVAMSTPVNVVGQYNLDGTLNQVLADYTLNTGDTPVALVPYDSVSILALIENATNVGNRRVDRIFTNGSGYQVFLNSAAAFNAATDILNDLAIGIDGGLLISRGQAAPNGQIEKFNTSKAFVQFNAINYVNNPAAPCATATTRFTKIVTGPNGAIIAAHAAATPNNRIDIFNPNGYQVAGDCFSGIAGPSVNHFPTAMVYHQPTGYLFVAYENNAGPIHQIYAYSFNGYALSLVNPNPVYNNPSVVQGVSAMSVMSDGSILVANSAALFNTVERFTWNSSALALERFQPSPVVPSSAYTRSISAIISPAE